MTSHSVRLLRLEGGMRWTARVLAVLLVGMVLLFFVADVVSGLTAAHPAAAVTRPLPDKVWDVFALTWLFSVCLGLALAWRWPLIGGAIASGGILLYYVIDSIAFRRAFFGNLYFDLMFLAGVLFMASALVRRGWSVPRSPVR
jgi:hypothetical protein